MLDFESFVRKFNFLMKREKCTGDSHDRLSGWMESSTPLTLSEYEKLYSDYCRRYNKQLVTAIPG